MICFLLKYLFIKSSLVPASERYTTLRLLEQICKNNFSKISYTFYGDLTNLVEPIPSLP